MLFRDLRKLPLPTQSYGEIGSPWQRPLRPGKKLHNSPLMLPENQLGVTHSLIQPTSFAKIPTSEPLRENPIKQYHKPS